MTRTQANGVMKSLEQGVKARGMDLERLRGWDSEGHSGNSWISCVNGDLAGWGGQVGCHAAFTAAQTPYPYS
jgi:hypothetical protein